ncbi:MAG: hypothetical protein ABH824_03200 [Nanoarchaeota archaeon]|nr:hypothetical protein [Nanoarchaeota archaeon]MBU1875919.1 hypothetical protein [Nanoarchaeota archaeon]
MAEENGPNSVDEQSLEILLGVEDSLGAQDPTSGNEPQSEKQLSFSDLSNADSADSNPLLNPNPTIYEPELPQPEPLDETRIYKKMLEQLRTVLDEKSQQLNQLEKDKHSLTNKLNDVKVNREELTNKTSELTSELIQTKNRLKATKEESKLKIDKIKLDADEKTSVLKRHRDYSIGAAVVFAAATAIFSITYFSKSDLNDLDEAEYRKALNESEESRTKISDLEIRAKALLNENKKLKSFDIYKTQIDWTGDSNEDGTVNDLVQKYNNSLANTWCSIIAKNIDDKNLRVVVNNYIASVGGSVVAKNASGFYTLMVSGCEDSGLEQKFSRKLVEFYPNAKNLTGNTEPDDYVIFNKIEEKKEEKKVEVNKK